MAAAIFVLQGRSVESILFVVGARESRAICLRRRLGFVLGEQKSKFGLSLCSLQTKPLFSLRTAFLNYAVTSLIEDTLIHDCFVHTLCFLRLIGKVYKKFFELQKVSKLLNLFLLIVHFQYTIVVTMYDYLLQTIY